MTSKDFKIFIEDSELIASGRILVDDSTFIGGYIMDTVDDHRTMLFGQYSADAVAEGLNITLYDFPCSIVLSDTEDDIKNVEAEIKEINSSCDEETNLPVYFADCTESDVKLYYDGELVSTNLALRK